MSAKRKYVQVWINLPGRRIQETLQARFISDSLFQICEIPFITSEVSYLDIVRCEDDGDTPRLITKVVKPSGFATRHIMFAQEIPKAVINKHIRVLTAGGAAYRRSGLRAFSISIPPTADFSSITEEIRLLSNANTLIRGDREGIELAEQASRILKYLMGKRPKLQNGSNLDRVFGTNRNQ